jgi:hypothetical protein
MATAAEAGAEGPGRQQGERTSVAAASNGSIVLVWSSAAADAAPCRRA